MAVVLGALVCGVSAAATDDAAPSDEESRSVLARFREADAAARTNLRTGRAEGSFRMWFGDNELVQSARFSGVFDGSKHYLKLIYEPTGDQGAPIEYDKRIVVCDGSELFVSRFSERIMRVGAEVDIYPGGGRFERTAMQGFPCGLKSLAGGILRPGVLDKHTVKVEKLANGHFRGTYEITPEYYETFEIAPEYGYQCILRESVVRGQLAARWSLAWHHADDLWHAASGKTEKYREARQSEAYEWQFDKFEPNVPVSPELFTLNALELPDGARLLDRRRPEGTPLLADSGQPGPIKPRVYRLPEGAGKMEQSRADRLVEQIEAMSNLHETEEVTGAWGGRIWGVAIGLLGIVAIVLVWFFYQRKARSGTGGGC